MESRAFTLLVAVVLFALAVAYSQQRNEQLDIAEEAELREMFGIPADVPIELMAQRSRNGARNFGMKVVFPAGRYDGFVAGIGDRPGSADLPREVRGMALDGPQDPAAFAWVDGDAGAFYRCFWVDWGVIMASGVQQIPPGQMRSMCLVAVEVDGRNEIRPCRDAGEHRRHLQIRAALDVGARTLYAVIEE